MKSIHVHRLAALCVLAAAGAASAQVTVDGRRNQFPANTNPYGAPLATQRSTVISFENAPRVNMTFQSDQSNVGGKGAYLITGTTSAPDESDPATVVTGTEFRLRLSDLGITSLPPEILVAGFVNGSGHDFVSNQVIGGLLNDPGNLGEVRNVNFANLQGDQFVRVSTTIRSAVAPVIDGVRNEAGYVNLPHTTVGTAFGSSNLNPADRNRANGSEITGVSAYIWNNGTAGNPNDDWLVFHVAGNLETNFNKLELFFDYIANQGQNPLLGNNADVSFNGLNRMGAKDANNPNTAGGPDGPGLTFDTGFRPDYWISVTTGYPGNPPPAEGRIFVDASVLLTNGGGTAGFAGEGICLDVPGTPGQFDLPGLPTPPVDGFVCDIDNSNSDNVPNSGGVGGRINSPGSGSQPDVTPAAGVTTGFEFKINLEGIGYPVGQAGTIDIAGAIIGFNFDFMSNQAIGGLTSAGNPDPNNLAAPAQNVNFKDWDGNQFVSVNVPANPAAQPGGVAINGRLDPAEAASYGSPLWVNTTNATAFGDSIATPTFTPGPNRSNGSELNSVYFYVARDPSNNNAPTLYGLVTGNLHDFNKLVLFFDTAAGGQNDIRGDNASIDGNRFNTGLGGVDGFEFDENFDADYAISYTLGFDTNLSVARHFADGIQLLTDGGGYGGRFGGGDKPANTPPVTGTVIGREGFGNNDLPGANPPGAIRTVNANGSELDAVYLRTVSDGNGGGTLYMFFAGNFEPNATNLELFFDTVPNQGQNRLIFDTRSPQDPLYAGNPDTDFGALNRMGGPVLDGMGATVNEGFRFDDGFTADYYFTFRANDYDSALNQVNLFGNYARLRTVSDPVGPLPNEADRYFGIVVNDPFDSFGSAFTGGDQPEDITAAALANNNTGGVPGGRHYFCPGSPSSDPATVTTGLEIAINLADLGFGPGNPYINGTSQLNFTVFLNGPGHGNVSNQFLQHACVDDLGEPRDVNLAAIAGPQYVGYPVPVAPGPNCTAPVLDGDANRDGIVNFSDITGVLQVFNTNPGVQSPPAFGDANADGSVNFSDITRVLQFFNTAGLSCN
ncbi:MAG: dockerin type I domain-containing protein [Planctomycetota bacterium]|nr:dockerin type I domain-containing protein [Planctomycetota bacterium]